MEKRFQWICPNGMALSHFHIACPLFIFILWAQDFIAIIISFSHSTKSAIFIHWGQHFSCIPISFSFPLNWLLITNTTDLCYENIYWGRDFILNEHRSKVAIVKWTARGNDVLTPSPFSICFKRNSSSTMQPHLKSFLCNNFHQNPDSSTSKVQSSGF